MIITTTCTEGTTTYDHVAEYCYVNDTSVVDYKVRQSEGIAVDQISKASEVLSDIRKILVMPRQKLTVLTDDLQILASHVARE